MKKPREGTNLRRAIQDDRVRSLYDKAVGAGWIAEMLGTNHIRLKAPTGSSFFVLGATMHHPRSFWNVRAKARRAGLDV